MTPARVRAALAPGAIVAVFQPIVRLDDWTVIGYEALARPRDEAFGGPEGLLRAADAAGLRAEAELACWGAALDAGPVPGGALLFLNVSPRVLSHPGFLELASRLPREVVLELTERESVEDYPALRRTLGAWAERGALVAIDDVGAGFSSITTVLEVGPSFVKIARPIVAGLHRDPRRREVVSFLVRFAAETGVTVVAEGVEEEADLIALHDLGVACVQGYLPSRPAPPWPVPALEPPWASAPTAGVAPVLLDDADPDPVPGLATAPTVREACRAVVAAFARREAFLTSLYLERGGLLRCQGLQGYWQLLDGMPPGAGVIGTVFRTGEPTLVEDVAASGSYLEATPGVRAEACVPVVSGSVVVGALNIESTVTLPVGLLGEMRTAARDLGDRIEALGGLPRERRSDRLARHAATLAGLVDGPAIAWTAAVAAADVAELSSAMIATAGSDGTLLVRAATGPLAPVFDALDPEALRHMLGWVDGVRSCYTYGHTSGQGLVGHEVLRAGGAEALVVLPIDGTAGRTGILVLADAEPLMLRTEDVELLELLAAQASACLRTAAALEALSDRASRDPLTGLGHHATFRAALAAAAVTGTDGRRLAVLVVDVDCFKEINDRHGHLAGDDSLRAVAGALATALRTGDALYRIGGDEFAALICVGSEAEAFAVGGRLLEAARALDGMSVSVGIAIADGAESADALLERADAALYDVKRGGRDGVALAPESAGAQAPLWA